MENQENSVKNQITDIFILANIFYILFVFWMFYMYCILHILPCYYISFVKVCKLMDYSYSELIFGRSKVFVRNVESCLHKVGKEFIKVPWTCFLNPFCIVYLWNKIMLSLKVFTFSFSSSLAFIMLSCSSLLTAFLVSISCSLACNYTEMLYNTHINHHLQWHIK